MSNSESNNVVLNETERKIFLQEFKQVAHNLKRYSLLGIIVASINEWFSLNTTVLIQRIGYNRRKLGVLEGKKIILNIGCTDAINNSYINADLFPSIAYVLKAAFGKFKIENDLFVNLTHLDSNLLGVADGIILSHVLEHIPPTLAITAIKNCFAYLKVGGHVRVSVPYLGAYDQSDYRQCTYVNNRMLAKNQLIYGYGHQFMYDADLLTLLMEEAGFSEVKEVTFGKGPLGETDLTHRKPESIYLTSVKT